MTSSFSWLMRMKLSVPPESIDWVMELLMGGRKEHEANRWKKEEENNSHNKVKTSYLSPLDGFISSFGFFFGVSFWIEDDLWLQKKIRMFVTNFGIKTVNLLFSQVQ